VLAQFHEGEAFSCTLRSTRKPPKLFSKYWAVLKRVIDGTSLSERWPTPNALSHALMTRAGHHEAYETIGGSVMVIPRSPAELSEEEFRQFYDPAIDYVCQVLCPGLDRHALEEARQIVFSDDDML